MKRPAATKKQTLAFRYALKHPYSIIAMDPRLGKSRVAIGIRERTKLNCLIICPSYLVLNWLKEIKKWAPESTQTTVIQKGKDIYEVCDSDYVIVSYNLAQKAENFFEWADMVVIDEGHNIKAMEAVRTQAIHKFIFENSLKRLHILTGTPLKNRVKEFYSLLALMYYNPDEPESKFLDLYPSEIDFADQFSYRKSYKLEINNKWVTILKWIGLKNLPELRMWLKQRYIRIVADENDLPPVQYQDILISNNSDPQLLATFESYFTGKGTDSVKPEYKKEAAVKKVPFTIQYVDNLLEQVNCAVIFTDHVPSAEAIASHFGVLALTGKVPAKIRSNVATEFQNGRGSILVATIGALKEGRDLYRARDVVFNDICWVPGDLKQATNRIRAMGEKNPVTVHKILGSPQDEKIFDQLMEKQATIDKATRQ